MCRDLKKLLLTAALVVLTCGLASAQQVSLAETYVVSGTYSDGQPLGAGLLLLIGPLVNVNCPAAVGIPGGPPSGTCTIQADLFVQQGGGKVKGNEFQTGFVVDGQPVLGPQLVGETPSDGSPIISSTEQMQAGVPPGNHTVQMFVGSQWGCSVYSYSATFRVYLP